VDEVGGDRSAAFIAVKRRSPRAITPATRKAPEFSTPSQSPLAMSATNSITCPPG
jgi:hypothetical protein